jgi:hypothetical protein
MKLIYINNKDKNQKMGAKKKKAKKEKKEKKEGEEEEK